MGQGQHEGKNKVFEIFILIFHIQLVSIQYDNTIEFAFCTIRKAKLVRVCSVWCIQIQKTKDGDEWMYQATLSLDFLTSFT